MQYRWLAALVIAALVIAALVIAAAVAVAATPARTVEAGAGGTYRVGWESSFGFTDDFDPTGEYLQAAIDIYSNLLVRTLVGYNHVSGAAGNRLVPDLATTVPLPTDRGTTYTFHLKRGIEFGPPVNRPVTSKDVLYAFERLARPKDGAEYGFYYTVIRGLVAYGSGKARTITGISTPDAGTIVFHLVRPTGDFLYRLAMPAAGPIPAEVAGCFSGQPGRYGRDLVSTGPYMLEGADAVDASSCAKLRPMRGFDGQTTLKLVRNPRYDPTTDSIAARESLPDAFSFTTNSSPGDIAERIEQGDLEDELPGPSPQLLSHYSHDRKLQKYIRFGTGRAVFYLTMNLTQPPFDDIHVRRAMNWIMDKSALVQASGGGASVANHIVPDVMFDGALAGFAPYATPGDHGSLSRANAAMRGSRYDIRGDGTCGAPACKHVVVVFDVRPVDEKLFEVVEASARKIGITFEPNRINGVLQAMQTTAKNIPFALDGGWVADYADAFTLFAPLFDGRTIIPVGNANYSLVGLTPAAAPKLGVTGTIVGVPSVDDDLDRCAALLGQRRLTCYENLDRKLMTKVVPWIPYASSGGRQAPERVLGAHVTKWKFDEFGEGTAYAHVAVT